MKIVDGFFSRGLFLTVLVAIIIASSNPVQSAQLLRVVDDLDRTVVLPAPAQRIVALAPHSVENLFTVGAGHQLVGRIRGADFPKAAQSLPLVGDYQGMNLEAIVALKPDLLVLWPSGNGRQWIPRLEKLGIPVYADEPHTLQGVSDSLQRLGRLTGNIAQATQVVQAFERQIRALDQTYSGKAPVSVFYQIWHKPLQTLNGTHVVSDVLRLCGGRNIFAKAKAIAPQVSVESVLMKQPQVIFYGRSAKSSDDVQNDDDHQKVVSFWQRWPSLPAVKHQALIGLNSDWMHRHTPRLALGAESVCTALEQVRRSH